MASRRLSVLKVSCNLFGKMPAVDRTNGAI
jgi:hypothetical protein